MLFNSFEFIFIFLPLVIIVYWLLVKLSHEWLRLSWLLVASIFFYSYWRLSFLPLLVLSISINFGLSRLIRSARSPGFLYLGITFNLGLLFYFKYLGFFSGVFTSFLNTGIGNQHVLLPLGISFYTFQQISFLVDTWRDRNIDYQLRDYALFVTFFPQLIAGPILHHAEFMPQLKDPASQKFSSQNFIHGLTLFSIGLFHKVVMADSLAPLVNAGFAAEGNLSFLEAWAAALGFTFQLYFDFAGYSEMALGLGWMFNLKFPHNFNAPYRATSIREFWAGWHITLTRWFQDYLYYPLALIYMRRSFSRFAPAIPHLFVFALIGFWHGAGWGFIIFGIIHGLGMFIHRSWTSLGYRMNSLSGWLLTFIFVCISWVFFRATDVSNALRILRSMSGLNGIHRSGEFTHMLEIGILDAQNFLFRHDSHHHVLHLFELGLLVLALVLSLFTLDQMISRFGKWGTTASAVLFGIALFILSIRGNKEFLYFNF